MSKALLFSIAVFVFSGKWVILTLGGLIHSVGEKEQIWEFKVQEVGAMDFLFHSSFVLLAPR